MCDSWAETGNVKYHAGEFLPSVFDQKQLKKEMTFIFSTSIIEHNSQLQSVYDSIYPNIWTIHTVITQDWRHSK